MKRFWAIAFAVILALAAVDSGWAAVRVLVDLYPELQPDGNVYTIGRWSDGGYSLAVREYPEQRPDGSQVYVWLWDNGAYSVAVREYSEIAADGSLRLVRRWEDGGYTVRVLSPGVAAASSRAAAPAPPAPPAPAPAAVPAYRGLPVDTSAEATMLDLVNGERAKAGLGALQFDDRLRELGRQHSAEMVQLGYFDHNSPVSGSPFDRMRAGGVAYTAAGENLASASDVQRAHKALMESSTHRANILRPQFGHIGIGVVKNGSKIMLAQEFTN